MCVSCKRTVPISKVCIIPSNSMCSIHLWLPHPLTCRNALIEQLMREGVDLKERVSVLQTTLQAKRTETETSQEKLRETQMELTEYKEIAEQACSENVLLKNQVQPQCLKCV